MGFLVVSLILAIVLTSKWGRPCGANSGFALVGVWLWTFVLTTRLSGHKAVIGGLVPLTLLIHWAWPFLPLSSDRVYDTRFGRNGLRHWPDIVFAVDSPYTELVYSYLRSVKPMWMDYYSRGKSYSLVEGRWPLPRYLEMLPSESAQRRVLACVTDRDNLVCSHQSLLLVAIDTFGYPNGDDAGSWWRKNAHVFQSASSWQEASLFFAGMPEQVRAHVDKVLGPKRNTERLGDLRAYLRYVEWLGPVDPHWQESEAVAESDAIGDHSRRRPFVLRWE
jgi:hypothetical protein